MQHSQLFQKIVHPGSDFRFEEVAMEVFRYQSAHVSIYKDYLSLLKIAPESINDYKKIPFLPISFFKSHEIISNGFSPEIVFSSSGTTGQKTSKHLVAFKNAYIEHALQLFEEHYGALQDWCVLALLPSYLERTGSSLVLMAESMIAKAKAGSGFYLHNHTELAQQLRANEAAGIKTLLLGVTFGLLDFAEHFSLPLQHTTIMETGGMKGRREEMTREQVHRFLQHRFGPIPIHSEYGMTELLSQAYSDGGGLFKQNRTLRILLRDTTDPLSAAPNGKSGGINIIDLANFYSCSFIATEDLGKLHENGQFEVIGRFDQSEARGCNLMIAPE
ncbi:MAG: acyl transferase [Flavobacteriales bacterium]